MHLIIFDIDGTLAYPHDCESICFEQALTHVTGISHISKNWQEYKHVTDIGIAQECIARYFQRHALPEELAEIEKHFLRIFHQDLFQQTPRPIPGVHALFQSLSKRKEIALAIATGSYYHSALLKLRHIDLPVSHFPLASCQDGLARVAILQEALEKATLFYQQAQFQSITYVGDGPWDIQAVNYLKWNFIGIASSYSQEQLMNWGAKIIFENYLNVREFPYLK